MRDKYQSQQYNSAISNILTTQVQKIKQENTDRKKEYEKRLATKNSKINDL